MTVELKEVAADKGGGGGGGEGGDRRQEVLFLRQSLSLIVCGVITPVATISNIS